jgi:hypothetical protein
MKMMNSVIVWILSLAAGYVIYESGWGEFWTIAAITTAIWGAFFLGFFDDARS